ncbi:efflux RND transporter permease subunit [Fusibacter sp. JL216-2]|uniref:efflux RND transporter permease subunit n=1 Tax=Fusibacter sp. JL216-2 TaxID=3071453 RepID=UPI003D327EC3
MKKNKIQELNIENTIIGRVTEFFVGRFQMAILLILLIIGLGVSGILLLPRESLPEIVFPAIVVQTIYPGASPEDVEDLITDKIESKLGDLEDLDEIQSNSSFGFSTVTLVFVEGTDMDSKKLEVDNELSDIAFPDDVDKPTTSTFSTSEIPLLQLSVSGNYSIFALTSFAEDLEEGIEGIPGVDEVNIFGGLDRQVKVHINQSKMLEYGVSITDIQRAISSLNIGFPVGEADLSGQRYNLRIDEKITTAKDIEDIVMKTPQGSLVFIRDVADVVDTSKDVKEYNMTYLNNGQGKETFSSILIEVLRETDSDVVGTSQAVKDYIESQRGGLYPDDLRVNISSDLAEDVDRDLESIQSSAISGLIVVILVLFLFIGFKESLIVSITIPMTLLITLGVLDSFGISLNGLSILGLIVALGLLVDNSIIVMENMDRLNKLGAGPKQAAIKGVNQVGFPVMAATLTTIAAFFPLAILPGIMGAFINSIPRTIIIALTASFFVAITITPAVYSRLMRKRKHGRLKKIIHSMKFDSKVMVILERILSVALVVFLAYYAFSGSTTEINLGLYAALFFGTLMALKVFLFSGTSFEEGPVIEWYQRLIRAIVSKRWRKVLAVITGFGVLVGSFGLIGAGLVKISFFPANEPISMNIQVDTPGGTTLEETADIVSEVEAYLKTVEDIDSYNATIGGNEVDRASVIATFKDQEDMSKDGYTLVEEAEAVLSKVAGANIIISGSMGQGPPVGKPVSLNITGTDLGEMKDLADAYAEVYSDISGVYNIDVSAKEGVPQIYINVLERKAQSMGLTVQQIAQQLRSRVDGVLATTMKVDREEVEVVVMMDDVNFSDIESIKSIHIQTPTGDMVPLTSVAILKEISGFASIRHVEKERIITLEADLKSGFNINDVTSAFEEKSKNIEIPRNVKISYGGDIEGIQESFADLFRSMMLAVFLVFIILSVQFNSVAQPFAILMTVPMAMIGVIVGLAVTGNDFGFYAFMGLVALVGIAVNDAIVLIDFMNYKRSTGSSLTDAIVESGAIRFNPVLATTLTTIGGVLPLAFRDVYYAQFSFSLVFGLLVTTVLTLIFIPIFYSMIEGFKEKRTKDHSTENHSDTLNNEGVE